MEAHIFFPAPTGSSFLFFLLGRMKAKGITGVYVTFLLHARLCLGSERGNKVNYTFDNRLQIRFNYKILFMYFLSIFLKNILYNTILCS